METNWPKIGNEKIIEYLQGVGGRREGIDSRCLSTFFRVPEDTTEGSFPRLARYFALGLIKGRR